MAVIVFATLGITITGFFARRKTAEEEGPVEGSG